MQGSVVALMSVSSQFGQPRRFLASKRRKITASMFSLLLTVHSARAAAASDTPQRLQQAPAPVVASPIQYAGSRTVESPSLARLQSQRSLRRAGVYAIVSGVVLASAAVLIARSSPCSSRAGNSCFVDARRRATWTLAVPAGLLTLGGAVLLGLGLRRSAGS